MSTANDKSAARHTWAARWPRQLASVTASLVVNPLWLGIILFALAWAALSTMFYSPVQPELLLVVLLYLVILLLLYRPYGQFKKALAIWQGAPGCWIELSPNPVHLKPRTWLARQLKTPTFWRHFTYSLFGAMLDGLLSLTLIGCLVLAVSEIVSAFRPNMAVYGWTGSAMPAGVFGSIFGWHPMADGSFHFVAYTWMRVGDWLLGLVALAAFAPIVSLAAMGQVGLTRLFLAPSAAETQRRLTDVQTAKDSAALAEALAMSRIERDLHDGPQQKLIGLGFDIGTLQRRLESGSIEDAKTLAAAMKLRTDDVLAEIRSLSRGFAPPVLADKGLAEAVVALAAAAPVPTTVTSDLGADRLPDPVERAIYYAVSEALTNVGKHANASAAHVSLSHADDKVTAVVTDDGIGGATMTPGHGLAGLADRIAGVSGSLDIASAPAGGTTITVIVPVSR